MNRHSRGSLLQFILLTLLLVPSSTALIEGRQAPTCQNAEECRQLAFETAAQGDYERFHDLAWRAVQTGPKNDPGLMYLLARAQALSGRPHDALIMLQRLAERGFAATGATTEADFKRTRELPGWPDVADAIVRAAAETPVAVAPLGLPPASEAAATAAAPPASPSPLPAPARSRPAGRPPATEPSTGTRGPLAAAPSSAPVASPAFVPFPSTPAQTQDAARFSSGLFRPAGLAYDAVSRRFVIGDSHERKLIVVGLESDHADDMVRAESAGFEDVVALDIDERGGDLWVTTEADASGSSGLHRLQLVSGRPLRTYRAAPASGPTQLVDLAVLASGGVIALDSAGVRLLYLARGSSDMTVAMSLELSGVTSVAARDDNVLFVAHDEGVARVDLRARTVAAVSAGRFDLRRFVAIRAYRRGLVGLQSAPDGSRQLVRLALTPSGQAVSEGTVIDPEIVRADGRVSLTIAGDDLYYLATGPVGDDPPGSADGPTAMMKQFVVRRLSLR